VVVVHATLLLEIGGATILTDPNFDDALGAFTIGSRLKRVSPPGIALAALPHLDAVLVTHAHIDHLSFDSLRALPAEKVTFRITTPSGAFTGPPHVATPDGKVTANYAPGAGDPTGTYTIVASGGLGTTAQATFVVGG
jgi:glyoxylase-like metal-dependent hydrolase (beta-lactamase superfamily II)